MSRDLSVGNEREIEILGLYPSTGIKAVTCW